MTWLGAIANGGRFLPAISQLGLQSGLPLPVLVSFGRVPFFYYVLHIFLIHLLAVLFAAIKHGTVAFLFQTSLTDFPANPPAGYGYGLPVVYLVWIALILMLTPACRWFANLKARRRDPWLSYL